MSNLYNLDLEKNFLARAIEEPSILDELINVIGPKDFSETHRPIFQAIQAVKREKNGECNKILVIDKLKACSVKIGGDIEAEYYINNGLGLISVSKSAAMSIAADIANKTIQRELYGVAKEILEKTGSRETKNGLTLLKEVNEIFNKKVNILNTSKANEPKDLFAHAEEYIELLGNNPHIDGVQAPFPIFRELFGDFGPGDMSFVIARPKAGKSTFLLNSLIQIVKIYKAENKPFKSLYLDTELEFEREIRRMVSALSGVGEYYLRTGFYRKNEEMTKKVRAIWPIIKEWTKTIDHIYVGGKKLDEILSIVRRWHGKNVGMEDKIDTIVALDYIKLGAADDLSGPVKDYQLVGQKVDAHKQLATELQYHCLTAGQANRGNEGRDENKVISDGSVVGLSDQISQFASNIYLLQKLNMAQVAMFKDIASHSFIPLYTRNQGPESQGFNSLVKFEQDGKTKYCENYLLFDFKNFDVKEITDFKTFVRKNEISDKNLDNGDSNAIPAI